MRYRGVRSLGCLIVSCLLVMMSFQFASAQQPVQAGLTLPPARAEGAATKATGEPVSLEEMLSTIRRLELRVRELEGKLEKTAVPAPTAAKVETVKSPLPGAQDQ